MSNRKLPPAQGAADNDAAARLELLISQGRIVLRRMHGLDVLAMCLRFRTADMGEVDAGWIVPALEVLAHATSDLEEWFDGRLDIAEASESGGSD